MLGALRSADAGPRAVAARIGVAALLACIGMTWVAGASDAFATYGTVSITKINSGGAATDTFGFADASKKISSTGAFTLKGGATYANTRVLANTGTYAAAYVVSEQASANYDLAAIACTTGAYSKAVKDLAARSVSIKVAVGEKVACTFTNQRKTGKIIVVKDLVPYTDAGRFDLKVGDKVVKAAAGDGDSGYDVVPTGTYQVSEYADYLGDYVRSTTCKKPNGYVVASGSGAVDVPVGAGDVITCTVKNVRKAKLIVIKHTVPADATTDFPFTLDGSPFTLKDGQSETRTVTPGDMHTVVEADPAALGYKLTELTCTKGYPAVATGATSVATRTATVTPEAGETVTCEYTNTRLQAAIDVDKSGPAFAYSGDTLDFGFDVTNPGEVRLGDIDVTDSKCTPVHGPEVVEGNDDAFLDPGETWHYTCSYVATHAIGDANPVTNVVTAQGTDDFGRKVEDEDTHATLFLHPAIDIDKAGPATAIAGTTVPYTLAVSNTGDVAFAAAKVVVSDARCSAAPALTSVNGDTTPDSLDPGDAWTYACSATTAVGQTSVVNVAGVTGTDEHGHAVTDESTVTTPLTQPTNPNPNPTPVTPVTPAAQQVAGVSSTSDPVRPGRATLRGTAGCPRTGSVSAAVTGRSIRRVTFFVDGRRMRTVTKADSRGRWMLTLRRGALKVGVHTVAARVQFISASGTKSRTLRTTLRRCSSQALSPSFTG